MRIPFWVFAVAFALGVAMGWKIVAQRADLEASHRRAASLSTNLKDEQNRCAALEEELLAESEKASKLEKEKAARDDAIDQRMKEPGSLVCQMQVTEWTARVEGAAGVPPLTLRKFTDFVKGQGPEPFLTKDQRRTLSRAIDEYPPPACAEGS